MEGGGFLNGRRQASKMEEFQGEVGG